jgi:hypothetical protein
MDYFRIVVLLRELPCFIVVGWFECVCSTVDSMKQSASFRLLQYHFRILCCCHAALFTQQTVT